MDGLVNWGKPFGTWEGKIWYENPLEGSSMKIYFQT